jgi:hypothetical protein
MNRQATRVGADELDFAAMDPNPDLEASPMGSASHRCTTANGSCRPVEDRKEPIPGRRHLAPSEVVQFVAQEPIVRQQQVSPRVVADTLNGRR